MGQHYKADVETPFWTAFWRNQRTCKFVEESQGQEGSGVFMFRNLYNRANETKAKDLTGGAAAAQKEVKEKVESKPVSAMQTAMSTGRNMDARRRLSQSARASLPVLVEA
jgi:omega-6 fatty acid desaturase (delta-12 desaturase)